MSRIWYSTSVQSRRLAEQIWVLFFSTFFENKVQNNITCNCMYKYEYFFLFDEIQNQNEIVFYVYLFFKKTKWQELRNLPLLLFSKMISEGLDLCLQRFLIKEVPKKLEYSCAIIKFWSYWERKKNWNELSYIILSSTSVLKDVGSLMTSDNLTRTPSTCVLFKFVQ